MGESVSPEILAALDRGLLVLTVNDRAARAVRRAWDRLQLQNGRRSWEPANVLSWQSWTRSLWKSLLLDSRVTALLLSLTQEKRVWGHVIASGSPAESLRSPASLAKLTAATWQQLCAFEGRRRFEVASLHLQGDYLQFALWARAFEEMCVRESLLSEALLDTELQVHLQRRDMERWSRGILLLGFDQCTPAQDALIRRCRFLGCMIEVAPGSDPGVGVLVAALDEKEELRGCARWIRDRLDEAPLARGALIVSDLEGEMDAIEAVLREELSPELENIAADSSSAPYEFSLGRPLLHEPMVQCALNLLQWVLRPLGIGDLSQLLLSPYFANKGDEAFARAEFDTSGLRQELRLRPEVTLGSFLRELRRSMVQPRLPMFYRVVERMAQAQSHLDLHPRGFGDWAEWIRAWLVQAHWNNAESTLSSREYQVRRRWEDALDDLASLDFLGEAIPLDEALATLDRLVKELIFAPASRDASVQVLSPFAAAGERFDFVWVLRAGEFNWPPGSAPSSLLPRSLQRDLGMPGTEVSEDREAALNLIHRLAGNAGSIVFSYAKLTADGGHQRAAAIVRDLQYRNTTIVEITSPERLHEPVKLERVLDQDTVSPLPTAAHRGGARVLELQAACGFRAFAELRLGSSTPRERDTGLDAMERGSMVHSALETFWGLVGSQQDLIAMQPGERDQTIRQAVAQSLTTADRKRVDRWDEAYLEVQQSRLTGLLNEWLPLELQRPSFTVVAQEKKQHVSIGPLQLSLRVDRVDLVEGRHVVLDYKTGEANPSQWLSDRPDQPQVPLYAILSRDAAAQAGDIHPSLGAVGFAQVRAGEGLRLRGFEAEPGLLFRAGSRKKPEQMDARSFEDQVVRWREVLERLAEDFVRGDTRAHPKRYPITCQRCGQRALCRVDGSLFDPELEDELESEES